MRFAVCDDDEMVTHVLDAALTGEGHELVGVASTTAAAVELIKEARPEVAIIDPAVGCNADFDAVDAAIAVGARVVVFSSSEMTFGGRYEPTPALALKPDVSAVEALVAAMVQSYPEVERRHQPTRRFASAGPSDAAAFYAAVNEAIEGDAFVAVSPSVDRTDAWVGRVTGALRETDLVLRTTTAVLVFMPGAGEDGVHGLHERLINDPAASNDGVMQAVVVDAGESPADAFARLKDATLPPSAARSTR